MKTLRAWARRWPAYTSLTVGLLLFFGGCSWKRALLFSRPSNQPTEQRWIIASIARDLANLAVFATRPGQWQALPADVVDVRDTSGAVPGQKYTLAIRLPGGGEPIRSELKLTGTAWSPELYLPTLQSLCARLKIAPPAPADAASGGLPDADMLKALTNPVTAELEAQNERLSGWLQAHPLDAPGHEQAALLLGTLAMRENSGLFWNPRGLCNRAAAHLAFARALRPEASECGEVAELLIGLIIDTKADCQRRIAALQGQVGAHPELGPWATAAAMRNTRDYRLLKNPKNATFLERVEQFRAMSEAISAGEAIKRLANHQPDTAPDWARIVLQAGYGVESGHQFAIPSVGLEINDAVQVLPDLRTARAPAQFAAVYNPVSGDAVQPGGDGGAQVRVIDQGTWAQFFQRHLLQAANETYNFLQNKWGVPDEATTFRVKVGPLLKPLTLYPLCLDFLGKQDGEALFPQAADLLNQHPEWVSDGAWALAVKTVPPQDARGDSWSEVSRAWFSPRVPTGTAYGFDWRTDAGNFLPSPDLPELQKLHDIAPLKYDVCREYANALAPDHHPSVAQFNQVMGALPSYYLPAMWGEAWLAKDDPAQYGAVMNRAGLLNPNYYFNLGQYYLDHRMEPEAAKAYQAAIDREADAVSISSQCGWLVMYYRSYAP